MKKIVLFILMILCTTNVSSQIFSGQKKAQVQAELASLIRETKENLPLPVSNTLAWYDITTEKQKNIVVLKYRFREDEYGSINQIVNIKENLRSVLAKEIKNDDEFASFYWDLVYLGMGIEFRICGNTSGKVLRFPFSSKQIAQLRNIKNSWF